MFLVFDTETTGLPRDKNASLTDFANWPRVVQLAWQLHGPKGELLEAGNHIVYPDAFTIPFNAAKVHGITTEIAKEKGKPVKDVLNMFAEVVAKSNYLAGHNTDFDLSVLGSEFLRNGMINPMEGKAALDTCSEATAGYCELPGGRGGKFKYPTLTELHQKLFDEGFGDAHNAAADVEATTRCFLELMRIGVFPTDNFLLTAEFFTEFRKANPTPFKSAGITVEKNASATDTSPAQSIAESDNNADAETAGSAEAFVHLRVHSTFTVLNSTIDIAELIKKAASLNMPAIGLTDSSNLMGAYEFINEVNKHNKTVEGNLRESKPNPGTKMKPVLGTEFNICRDQKDRSVKDNGFVVPCFAKNKTGYQNLSMLSSLSFTDGFYYVPRIDKDLLIKYKEGIIVTTGALNGEVPSLLLNVGEQQAEDALLWYKNSFGEDFYIELNRHGLEEENFLNKWLLTMAEKHGISFFAANNVYYLEKKDAEAHDFLICIKDNYKKDDPIGRGYGHRFGFPNDEFYFKSQHEMASLFADLPQAIKTITEITDKIETYSLNREVLLPEFEIPEQFKDPLDLEDHGKRGENEYLRYLTIQGANKRYGQISEEIQQRIDFELDTIERTGYPGYFLIVQDLIAAARSMGVWVGPGRGSAAGSLVAYCIGITNVDPLKYGLLFERFLNPERVSMPDIDIDFDDEGRSKVIEYVTQKYGQNKVAQIITYGTLGTKSAIRDIARALSWEQASINKLAASTNNIKLGDFMKLPAEKLKESYRPDQMEAGEMLRKKLEEPTDEGRVLKNTLAIEGLVRNTGLHACGIVITPTDLRELVPVTISKESNLWATQFDNAVAESVGLLKVDFLGLKTLSLIRDTIEIIHQRTKNRIQPDDIPLDDPKTYELFQHGETIGVFQYESPGMQKHLRELKPTSFNDLIAMNALYRPGPMAYIPNYVNRKHGREPITYDLEAMREYLEETYGITVYQEQVMLLSQKLSGFTKGQADTLRKAMGKKNRQLLDELYSKFISGGKSNDHPEAVLKKIWNDWLAFANYAFNKSHSTCYAQIAFQTAYLKANHPAEFMASVLSNNIGDIKQVTFFMEECKRMKIKVLGPDVNESEYKFTVNDKGEIRFGLGAIKNMGESAAGSILEERRENGPYKSVFDLLMRVNLRNINKRNLEALATAGAFDSFEGIHRAQFFHKEQTDGPTFLEKAIRFATSAQESKAASQFNLFGEELEISIVEPPFPVCERWSKMKELQMELDAIGFYISAHPMDSYKVPIRFFANCNIQYINESIQQIRGHKLSFAAQVVSVEHLVSQQGSQYARFKVEDHNSSIELMIFNENYLKVKHLIDIGTFVLIQAIPQSSQRYQDRVELRIQDIQLLDTVVQQSGRELIIKLKVEQMDEAGMKEFKTLLLENKTGKNALKLQLIDNENRLRASVRPSFGRVDAAAVLSEMDRFSFLEYELVVPGNS